MSQYLPVLFPFCLVSMLPLSWDTYLYLEKQENENQSNKNLFKKQEGKDLLGWR